MSTQDTATLPETGAPRYVVRRTRDASERALNEALGRLFARALKRKGCTPADLAAALDASPYRVARMLAGRCVWTIVDAFAAADYLNTDLQEVARVLRAGRSQRTLIRRADVDDSLREMDQ